MNDAAKGLDFAGLASAQVRLLVLLPVPQWALDKYAATQPALAPYLACDPSAAVFSALSCGFSFATAKLRPDSIHAHTGVLAATWKGLVQGLAGGMQGDPRQMGGALVLQGGDKVVWQHRDAYNADQVPIPVLLAAAGVDPALYSHKAAVGK